MFRLNSLFISLIPFSIPLRALRAPSFQCSVIDVGDAESPISKKFLAKAETISSCYLKRLKMYLLHMSLHLLPVGSFLCTNIPLRRPSSYICPDILSCLFGHMGGLNERKDIYVLETKYQFKFNFAKNTCTPGGFEERIIHLYLKVSTQFTQSLAIVVW